MQAELFTAMADVGQALTPGQLGENIATAGVDLLHLPLGTRLQLGPDAVVELTGLRTPCRQIEQFQRGLLQLLLDPTKPPKQRGKVGVMGIVLQSGTCCPGDPIVVLKPAGEQSPLTHI